MPPTDPNEAAIETWLESTDGFDRVEAVIQGTRNPETAAAIAERAHVSESSARKHLDRLVDLGVATATSAGRATQYTRNDDHYLMQRVRELQRTHSRDELVDAIAEMRAEIRSYRDRHDVESPEDLAIEADPAEGSAADSATDSDVDEAQGDGEPWGTIADWRTTETNLAVAQTALSFKRARALANA